MTTAQHETVARPLEPTRDIPVYTPATDIYEAENEIVVLADMPGVSEKDLEVTLDDRTLTLVGRRGTEHPVEYRRTFTLAEDLDRGKIAARIKAGQLRITLPKAAKAQPRRIAVENTD